MAEAKQPSLGWHRVCLNTIVRKEKVLDSERLRILPMGSRVNVVEQQGRRVRIDQPIVGWCSLNSSNGDTILKPLDANQAQKVAPTPRSGQAAVSNLEKKVKQAQEAITKAAAEGIDIDLLTQEKEQLEARIHDLQRKNEQQQKIFEDWKKASAANTTTNGTAPTNVEQIQWRNGDAIMIRTEKGVCELEGIAIVRCVIQDEKGEELIGCDYQIAEDPDNYPGPFDGSYNGEQKWKPPKSFKGVWLRRQNIRTLLAPDVLLKGMEQLEQQNTDLLYYERTAKAMIKKVKQFTTVYKEAKAVKIGDQEYTGDDYGSKFFDAFKTLQVTEE